MVIEKISIFVEIARRLSHRKGSTYWDFESTLIRLIEPSRPHTWFCIFRFLSLSRALVERKREVVAVSGRHLFRHRGHVGIDLAQLLPRERRRPLASVTPPRAHSRRREVAAQRLRRPRACASCRHLTM
eukprot:4633227-Prymnesium_polylepis.1